MSQAADVYASHTPATTRQAPTNAETSQDQTPQLTPDLLIRESQERSRTAHERGEQLVQDAEAAEQASLVDLPPHRSR